ncbi:MAG: beta-propeller domain-containing protein [Oscillospiraceae bacterium]|nr:beta-propeller domain-containing protein [Oscillospiraceae bacterium]
MNADTFLSEIKKLNFSGKEFLEILGNSKISNDVYNEIKESAGLTYGRLVELLENSLLTSEDFVRLLSDAEAMARFRERQNREQNEGRLAQALEESRKRLEERERTLRAAQLLAEAKKKAREEQLIKEVRETGELAKVDEIVHIEHKHENTAEIEPYEVKTDIAREDADEYEELDEIDEDDEAPNAVTAADNKGKLIICSILAVGLICASFTLRYFQTGSLWLEREVPEILAEPETYEELSRRLQTAGDAESPSITAGDYHFGDIAEQELPRTLLHNDRYIFNIIENKLHVLEVKGGEMSETAALEYEGETLREMYLSGGRVFVIAESEYGGEYFHVPIIYEQDSQDPDELLPPPEPVSGEFTQKLITVRVYDALGFSETPLLELAVDGEYNAVLFQGGRVILAATYTPHEPLAESDLGAFVPSYSVNGGEKRFIGINNIYAPPAPLMNTAMTVLSVISGEEAEIFAVVGGNAEVIAGANSLFVVQNTEKDSRLVKLDMRTKPLYYDINGVILPSAVDENESGNVIRVGSFSQSSNNSLFIFNNRLELISRVINIGGDEKMQAESVLFDTERVYFIASDKLFSFNTTEPDDIIPAGGETPRVRTDDFYRISDNERLEVVVETDSADNRAGIRLNVHKDARAATGGSTTEIAATYLITAESTVPGNWNPFLFTDAETSREAVFIQADETGRCVILIPVRYSNSISNIERLIVFDYNEYAGLVRRNDIVYYDINADRRRAVLIDGFIYSFWDTMAVSARDSDVTVVQKLEMS